jgi:hypothetical protein
MSFGFNISFSMSFTLSLGSHTTSDRHLGANVKDKLDAVSQRNNQPARVVEAPVAVSTPVRPFLSRFARYLREEKVSPSKQVLETKETDIIDAIRSRFLDRKSLQILIEASSQQRKPGGANISYKNIANDVPDASLVLHNPVAPDSTSPVDPYVSDHSSTDEDDCGSDLVSSLLGLRVGELSTYFQDLDKRFSTSSSPPSQLSASVKHSTDAAAEEEAYESASTQVMSDEEWEQVNAGEVQGEKQCWKKHRCIDG